MSCSASGKSHRRRRDAAQLIPYAAHAYAKLPRPTPSLFPSPEKRHLPGKPHVALACCIEVCYVFLEMHGSTPTALRRRAEAVFQKKAARFPEPPEGMSPEATRHMLHEPRVHQTRLEMQNEELRRTREERTVNVMPGDREYCLVADSLDDYLLKPFKRAELAAKLARFTLP